MNELLDPVFNYLRPRFQNVQEEEPEGDYLVVSLELQTGEKRSLKIHRYNFVYANVMADYLEKHDIASQLESGNVEIVKPLMANAG
jgi:hypothetical protein